MPPPPPPPPPPLSPPPGSRLASPSDNPPSAAYRIPILATAAPSKRRHCVEDTDPDAPWPASSSSSSSAAPDAKRPCPADYTSDPLPRRQAESADHLAATASSVLAMSAKALGKRPAADVIDLTGDTPVTATAPFPYPAARRGPFAAPGPTLAQQQPRSFSSQQCGTGKGAGRGGAGGAFGGTGSGSGLPASLPVRPGQGGARKLVVKNFRRTTSTSAVDEHFARTQRELETALAVIFASSGHASDERLPTSMLQLFSGVEDICRSRKADKLAEDLKAQCEASLQHDKTLMALKAEAAKRGREAAGMDDVALLQAVVARWHLWCKQTLQIRWIYSYLDRSFLLTSKKHKGINDMSIALFRHAVFGAVGSMARNAAAAAGEQDATSPRLGVRLLEGICTLVHYDRLGDARFDEQLLRASISMVRILNVYGEGFEPRFLDESHAYLEQWAQERSETHGLKDYIAACKRLLRREDEWCDLFNLESMTKRPLMDDAHRTLVKKYSEKLLDSGSVARLLDANDVESMGALYELLRLSQMQNNLRKPWTDYVRLTGAAIVGDAVRADEMVVRLLLLRRALDVMVRDAFRRDDGFVTGLRSAFRLVVNDRKANSHSDEGTSRVGEMIAKHMDMLLRGGLKSLPAELRSDQRDRAEAQQHGQGLGTADEEAELERQLDQALDLFRFVDGKDVFVAFYKKDLAKRLLMNRSASQDAERNVIAKLKANKDSDFTHSLEQMFKDRELANDEMASYKSWLANTGRAAQIQEQVTAGDGGESVDLTVTVLSASAWPSYPDVKVRLPAEVEAPLRAFDDYYMHKHNKGRRLHWKHGLAHCVVAARFENKAGRSVEKELLVSGFQATVLTLFNQVEHLTHEEGGGGGAPLRVLPGGVLSCEQVRAGTDLPAGELERTLQSLACGKARVLTKHPRGREVAATDTFTVNRGFSDPKFRVKINQIQLRETREENAETHRRVARDRQFETQAAVVRVMKSRKELAHAQLVAEVIGLMHGRGEVEAIEIKKNIEKLIEKEYLERLEGNVYRYLA